MVTNFKILCPHCQDTCEVFLTMQTHVVVLNCPHCWTPIVHTDAGVFILSDSQMAELASDARQSTLSKLLEKMAAPETPLAPRENSGLPSEQEWNEQQPCSTAVKCVAQGRTISHDDIINLQIDLATSRDVEEFIGKI